MLQAVDVPGDGDFFAVGVFDFSAVGRLEIGFFLRGGCGFFLFGEKRGSLGAAAELASNEDVKEFYLGVGGGERKSFKDVKSYKRRKRWLA